MPNNAQTKKELNALRAKLAAEFKIAQESDDTAKMAKLEAAAKDIDDQLDDLALGNLSAVASKLARLRTKVEKLTKVATSSPFGGLAGGSAGSGAKKNGGKPTPAAKVAEAAAVAGASDDQLEAEEPTPDGPTPDGPAQPVTAPQPSVYVTAPNPGTAAPATGGLKLAEAHLIALWKRSCFPIDGRGIILFGIRGCLPVDFAGTDVAGDHEVTLSPVNYRTMNCTLGQWRPGSGFALFPGSTVPFADTVAGRVASGGRGVNQLGRGRYKNYRPGWHKRSEGSSGHWALRQECPITLQRTGDDTDFDLQDRWEVGVIAGDNIHCAFHMGPGDNIPNSRFSSAGCQTVAGTVKKGVSGSERGPWAKWIAPFLPGAGTQAGAEYVLFDGFEVQQMIKSQYRGKTVILRIGSQGELVSELQRRLAARLGQDIAVDGDFGVNTFQAVIDFQSDAFGDNADDGIVGPDTARELGFKLPGFDFDDAISGGSGVFAAAAPADGVSKAAEKMAWGAVAAAKCGPEFNERVIEVADRLRCDPSNLMAVIAFESGETFSPNIRNAAGSGAVGLIQFMPSTAAGLGTSTTALAKMTAVEQLDFVEKHFKSVAGGRPLASLSDVYMAVLWPAAIGKPESFVLFQQPSTAYTQNKGLDVNKDGVITKAEATAKVAQRLAKGMKAGNIG